MKNYSFGITCRNPLHITAILPIMVMIIFCVSAVKAQSPELEIHPLSDKMLFIQGPDSNVLAVNTSEGIILVDGGHASWYDSLRQVVEDQFPGIPIRALINTQWHPQQTGANVPLGMQGVEIIAHENTMLWLGTEVSQRWSGRVFPPLPKEGIPTTTIWDDGVMQIGDRNVHYGFMWTAHTDGDIWVYFEEEDVLVTGGLVSNGRWPEIDWSTGGYIGGLLDGFVSLLSVPTSQTTIIPAFGGVMSLDELKAQNQMYLTIFDLLHVQVIQSFGVEDILAENPAAQFNGKMGDPTQFMTQAFQSFKRRYRDSQNFRLLNIP